MSEPAIVLMVDDSSEYLDAMEINLPSGCRALRAESVEKAKALVESDRPRLAVIDIPVVEDMACSIGRLEFLKWLHMHHPDVVVMICVFGAEYFSRKPIRPDAFLQEVDRALRDSK